MPRPPVVVIPGNSSGTMTSSTAPNLLEFLQGLNQLAQLYQGTIGAANKSEADQAGIVEMARGLGLNKAEAGQSAPAVQSPTGGMVNQPSVSSIPPVNFNTLAGSPSAAKAIQSLFEKKNAPAEYSYGNDAAFNKTNPQDQFPVGAPKQPSPSEDLKKFAEHSFNGDIKKAQESLTSPEGQAVFDKFKISGQKTSYDSIQIPDKTSSTGFRYAAWDRDTNTVKMGPEAPINRSNKPQQSNFVDENNNPYNFDPTSGNYVPATVTGNGKVMPRKKTLTSDITDNMAGGVTYLGQIDKIEKMYNNALAGPATGNANKAAGYVINNPEFQGLRLNVGTLRTVVYQLSGKQINESEQKWLENDILPSLTQPSENFKSKLGELKSWMQTKLKNQVETFGTSYIIPKNVDDYVKSISSSPTTTSGSKFKILKVE